MSDYPIAGTPGNLFCQKVTIPSGTSQSEMINMVGKAIVMILMPAAWTAAALGYKTCITGNANDLKSVYDGGGNPMTTVAAASTNIAFPTSSAIYTPFLAITSVTVSTVTGVSQGADREIIILFRNLFD